MIKEADENPLQRSKFINEGLTYFFLHVNKNVKNVLWMQILGKIVYKR